MAGKELREIHCWVIKAERLLIYLASSAKGAVSVGLLLDKGPECTAYFKKEFPDAKMIKDEEWNRPLIDAIEAAIEGKKIPVFGMDLKHTPFQMKAWKSISKIPFGKTMTYGEVASITGCPKGARAIGQAMNRNPLPLIFPCHRVVASTGLGGFAGGLELKRYLLEKEKSSLLKNIRSK
jgi:O-6-methylguanine DNA methyltransferase